MIIFCLAVFLFIVLATWLKYLWETKNKISLDLNYIESTKVVSNPERGWYKIYGCLVNDADHGVEDYIHFLKDYNPEDSLVLLIFNLKNYREGDISNEGIEYINGIMNKTQESGLKAIVRFVYDWDGYGLETEPESITTILRHMEQLSPSLYRYQDIIYVIQGLFIGSYGEMHSSKYLDKESVITLMNTLLESTPKSMKLSVRTPEYWRLITGRTESINKLGQLPGARIGLYNDGLSSSETDLGTYSDGTGYENKWLRKDEIQFQSELCRFVPNGGEFALDSEYNDLDNILKEFPLLHISYLNRDYNEIVLNKLKSSTYFSTDKDDPYNGVDGYKYIGDHMGYRLVLRDISISKRIFVDMIAIMEIEIENTGFANVYYPKEISLLLEGVNDNEQISVKIDTDISTWNSGEISKLKVSIPTNKLQDSDYKLYLKITDDNENGIQMANDSIYNYGIKANSIGQIQVEQFSFKNIWK